MAEIEAHLTNDVKGYITLYSEFYIRSFSRPTNSKTLNTKRYPDYRLFVVDSFKKLPRRRAVMQINFHHPVIRLFTTLHDTLCLLSHFYILQAL